MTRPTDEMLAAANKSGLLGNWIGERIDNVSIPNTERTRLSGACLHVSLTHHIAMATLIAEGAMASAFALLRPQIDSYARGLWLNYIASDDEIEGVKRGDDPPPTRRIAVLLEAGEILDPESLSRIAADIWPAVCDFTHTGIRVIYSHLRDGEISPSFSQQEVVDLFQHSNVWALTAAIALANLADEDELSQEFGARGMEEMSAGNSGDQDV